MQKARRHPPRGGDRLSDHPRDLQLRAVQAVPLVGRLSPALSFHARARPDERGVSSPGGAYR